MAQYPKIETIGSIGSIILAILEVQVFIEWASLPSLAHGGSSPACAAVQFGELKVRRWPIYYTRLYSTLLYSTLLYSTLLYSTIPYYTITYYTIPYYTILSGNLSLSLCPCLSLSLSLSLCLCLAFSLLLFFLLPLSLSLHVSLPPAYVPMSCISGSCFLLVLLPPHLLVDRATADPRACEGVNGGPI